jgi:hypothetical protein
MEFDGIFLIDTVMQDASLCIYNMHNIVEKHFSVSIATVRSTHLIASLL